jgi:hypothetical protein
MLHASRFYLAHKQARLIRRWRESTLSQLSQVGLIVSSLYIPSLRSPCKDAKFLY